MSKNIPSKKHYFVVKMLFSLLIVAAFLLTGFTHINAGTTPTTSILDVVEDVSVTIRTYDFPANQNFTVTMGKFGTRGVGGYIVETFNSGTGGSFDKTFTIPAVLLDETKIAIRLESPQGYYTFDWFYNSNDNVPIDPVIPSGYTGIPTVTVKSVVAGASVTLVTHNFPADTIFAVTMGEYGTLGVGGIKVADTDSGTGGSFEVTYLIPAALKDNYRIAIRLQSTDGFYAYNWFYNASAIAVDGYTGIPTTAVKSVDPGVSVTLITYNFPPDQVFVVTMGEFGTRGVGGIKVADTDSGTGGSFEVTYLIPAALKDNEKIAIRLESPEGYYAYDWFTNKVPSTPVVSGYTGYPTTSIKSVNPGVSVTITTYNFPPDMDFEITMGAFGTRGVGGTVIKTINSGTGGSFDVTCDIPAVMADWDMIAIRFQGDPYYAYDWFYN